MSEASVREALFYERLEGNRVRCRLCPNNCLLADGQRGVCLARENRGGKLYTLVYGLVTALAIDPIEKKPLFHFYPGAPILSISTAGCNFKCPWCQNWHISQRRPEDVFSDYMEPEQVVELMKRYGVPFLAFTYNEPVIWFEYVLETAKLARKEGFKSVLVTNGYINIEPLRELGPYIDAANVDIKAFKPETYLKYPKGKMEGVLEAVKEMKRLGWHIETTYLVVPGVNDDVEEFRSFVKWQIENLGPETPLHISRFFPNYRFLDRGPTPLETLEKLWRVAKEEGLYYVYTGNIPGHKGEHTYCPSCGKLVIGRYGFEVYEYNLTDDNRCKFCGAQVHIVGRRWRVRSTSYHYFF